MVAHAQEHCEYYEHVQGGVKAHKEAHHNMGSPGVGADIQQGHLPVSQHARHDKAAEAADVVTLLIHAAPHLGFCLMDPAGMPCNPQHPSNHMDMVAKYASTCEGFNQIAAP